MRIIIKTILASFIITSLVFCGQALAITKKKPKELVVYVSIKPIYSLVAMVAHGVFTPRLLNTQSLSPYNMTLSHQQQLALNSADAIFIVDDQLEAPIYNVTNQKYLKLDRDNVYVTADFKGMNILPFSNKNVIISDDFNPKKGEINYYIWLDPANAKIILKNVADILSKKDPAHSKQYHTNAAEFSKHIDSIIALLNRDLAPYKNNNSSFLLFHNGYSYFDDRFSIHAKGYIQFGLKKTIDREITYNNDKLANLYTDEELSRITNFIKQNNITCVFLNAQFKTPGLEKYLDQNKINHVELDAIGYNYSADWQLYSKIMANTLGAYKRCLAK
ncbi:metal ABC transporter solute-binding protein, Zn/Mn family [Rickettsiales bacterium LUAb2]